MGYDLEREIRRVLLERQTIEVATGMLMQTSQLTAIEAAARLRHMSQAFHTTPLAIATAIIDTRT
jgi:AmiR/NasT family two-component response regulator